MIKVLLKNTSQAFEFQYGYNIFFIKNKEYLRNLLSNLSEYLILSKDNKELKSSEFCFISNPIEIKLNDKKNLAYLYKNIISKLSTTYNEKFSNVKKELYSVFEEISDQLYLKIDANYEINLEKLLQSIEIQYKISDSFVENIINLIEIYYEIGNMQLIIFQNLALYLNSDEILRLNDELEKKNLILIDFNSVYDKKYSTESLIVIDEDLCII